ncbi:MAG: multicopper oxidase domain-containing protein [Bacteroidota bacterium]
MERRDFLRFSGMGAAYALLAGSAPFLLTSCRKDRMMDMGGGPVNVIEGAFDFPLPIPALSNGQGSLITQNTTHSIFNGKVSKVLGYQAGSILGPTIKLNSGSTVNLNLQNSLSDPTNIHWHGLVIPANMEGHPEDILQPGSSFNYNFSVSQRAGMYWYHPHPHGFTAKQTFKGLAGVFVVNDAEEQALNLPSGIFEIPLVIQDKRIFPDYALDYSPQMGEVMTGYMGQYITVNGVYSPYLNVNKRNYRIRVLNGSNARIYNIGLSNNASFAVIGSDGGLLAAPQTVNSLILGPGERADLIVDFSSYLLGTDIFLINKTFSAGEAQGTQEFKMMKFTVSQNDTDTFSLPGTLSSINLIPESSATKTRIFNISNAGMGGHGGHSGMSMKGMHKINDKIYDPNRIDDTVLAGATEIWVFDNSTGDEPHPMHIHGMQFQVLDRTGGRNVLIPTENGWKDTVMVMPKEKVRAIMTFHQNKGKYVVHCHNLEHEDDGMMLQFEVV